MCGICGIVRFKTGERVEESDIRSMMNAIKHRGPDDDGVFIDGNIGIGHVRLSIIDLSHDGHQPMASVDERFQIVFNGEIYNYIELRDELSGKYIFKSKTDTEVLLAAYQEWGEECLDRLNGMFAFAIYDVARKKLFLARDRFGIKPLYFYSDSNCFLFASDIPAIIATMPIQREADNQIIYDYLFFNRTNHVENTFFKNIHKVQHGHALRVMSDGVKIWRWYDLAKHVDNGFTTADELRTMFLSSIGLQLRSDVPVGACLSGGLDSSSIVSSIKRFFASNKIATFSAIYDRGEHGDESPFIDEYRNILQDMHFVKPSADSFADDINDFVSAMVEPIPGTSEYAEFKVMQLAKGKAVVLLNGQGSDELMAGYLYFAGYYYRELFHRLKWLTIVKEMILDVKNHKSFKGPVAFVYFSMPSWLKKRLSIHPVSYISKDFSAQYEGSAEILDVLYDAKTLKDSFLSHFEHKFEHHLIWADRSAMWFSLESRFPFLDHRFVERALAMPPEASLCNGWNKVIFREAMKGILPERIRMRKDKVGYETPQDEWFRTKKMQAITYDVLTSRSFRERGYCDVTAATAIFQKHLYRKTCAANDIWKCIHLELWFRKYIDYKST